MSGTTDEIKSLANEAIGKATQSIGEMTGSDKPKAEGTVQEAKATRSRPWVIPRMLRRTQQTGLRRR